VIGSPPGGELGSIAHLKMATESTPRRIRSSEYVSLILSVKFMAFAINVTPSDVVPFKP